MPELPERKQHDEMTMIVATAVLFRRFINPGEKVRWQIKSVLLKPWYVFGVNKL